MRHRVHDLQVKVLLGALLALAIATPASAAGNMISPYLVFNRCVGGCAITGGATDDARSNKSSIPCVAPQCSGGGCLCPAGPSGNWTVHEFTNQFGDIGGNGHCYGDNGATACTTDAMCSGTCTGTGSTCAGGTRNGRTCTMDSDCADVCDTADYEWNAIMACLKEVYSPYNVTVSDMRPSGGVSYTMDLVAGLPEDIGYSSNFTGGIAPPIVCAPRDNIISFSFANLNWGTGQGRIYTVCGVAAQETAHAFGLDHEYHFLDGSTAATDPMSYQNDCGGERFFRNKSAQCGEYAARDCACGGAQDSDADLVQVFGRGTSTVPAPTATITFPTDGATVTNAWNTQVSAGSRRGVDHVELWINGYLWNTKEGLACGFNGYPNPGTYSVVAPANVPDGNQKVTIKAFDDIGGEGDATIMVKKGAPCADASTCLAGQKCNTGGTTDVAPTGGCYWDPAVGNVGDKCTYPQYCTTGLCLSADGKDEICTQHCVTGVADSCPSNMECDSASDGQAYCFPKAADSGCCSTGSGPVWPHVALAGIVLGFVTRRRRQRASCV